MSRRAADEEFPPHVLREYALLADGERGALIGPRGDIAWLCAPRWDSDAVFSSLIGGQGMYAVTPRGRFVWGGYYEAGTLIWRSRWVTTSGIVESREALAFPGDPDRLVLLRRVIAVDTEACLDVILDPRAGFDRQRLTGVERQSGIWRGRCGALWLRWSGAPEARVDDGAALSTTIELAAGEYRDFVLELGARRPPSAWYEPEDLWRRTAHAWRDAVPDLSHTVAPRDAGHAYAVLRGLTGCTGGMVAAATASLPERAERGRDYDYRYVWIRDQAMAGQAVAAAGPYPLLDDAVRFISARLLADGSSLAPAYTVSGERVPDQHSIDLPGYPGGYDIIGNQVNAQFQLDAFGEALLLFAAAARHGRLGSTGRRAATVAVRAIADRWTEPEAGVWELDDHRWTESRLVCAAGLRALADTGAGEGKAAAWRSLADTLVADVDEHATDDAGWWHRAVGDPAPDAALLFPGVRGAFAPDDPRVRETVRRIAGCLGEDHYLYRFRHDSRPLGEAEGAFLLCGFIMAIAQHRQGNERDAVRWFERNRAACGPPGLFSEEYDVGERQLRGNLPQAFVHAALLEASARLAGPAADPGPATGV